MKARNEFATAVQLFLLLCLLFWSFTWNSDASFGSTNGKKYHHQRKDLKCSTVDKLVHQHAVPLESFSAVKTAFIHSSASDLPFGMLPPFNEWKKKELTKHEKSSNEIVSGHQMKTCKRKLNYSSSKCGAKVLGSNREAKHRSAILTESPDEYMLNPCRVRTWFVLELCDTVEATQLELANYELYSSSPKHFSVFWSEVYPTMVWHPFGTFEAKDQRTMQTFDLSAKNLGKFIKMIIFSHHGTEHYCPLSVVRVLGYSMVDKFQDMDQEKFAVDENKFRSDEFASTKFHYLESNSNPGSSKNSTIYSSISNEMYSLLLQYCRDINNKNRGKFSDNQPVCRFFKLFLTKSSRSSNTGMCSNLKGNFKNSSNFVKEARNKSSNSFQNHKSGPESKGYVNIAKHFELGKATNRPISRECKNCKSPQKELTVLKKKLNTSKELNDFTKIKTNSKNKVEGERLFQKRHKTEKQCVYKSDELFISSSREEHKEEHAISHRAIVDYVDGTDSAGLIQKESVFIKLTSRIQSLEVDLNLINKYLEQLSQSYRQEMELMQTLFNQTVKAIKEASQKASIMNIQQQEAISALDRSLASLHLKVQYIRNSQKDVLTRVVELHGFFIILGLIIISTIFTIFLNIINQKTTSFFEKKNVSKFLM